MVRVMVRVRSIGEAMSKRSNVRGKLCSSAVFVSDSGENAISSRYADRLRRQAKFHPNSQ